MIDSPLALTATVAAVAALGLWLEDRFRWAAKVGASMLIIALGAVLSNLDLVPAASPVYGGIYGPVTSLAIVWLLLAVDLKDLQLAGPRMLLAFALAAAATAAGAVAATLAFGPAVGPEAWKLSGVMTGTYTGGSLNFAAVGRGLGLPEALFTSAMAADNVLTALWLGATLTLPVALARFYPRPPEPPADGQPRRREATDFLAPVPMKAVDIALLLGLGLGVVWLAEAVAGWLAGVPALGAVPSVLWLTTLALAVGQLPPVRRLTGALQLGTLALNLFFVAIGIGSRVAEIFRLGPQVFYFTLTVVATHGLLTYGGARLFKLDLETTSVASQAAVGGPSTAMALAVARHRPELALPGVAVGLLGYAVGNYLGFAVAYLMRGLGGG